MPNLSDQKLLELMHQLLGYSDGLSQLGEPPGSINTYLPAARALVEKVAQEIAGKGHGAYFEVSKNRYAHYFAAGMSTLKPGSLILDVGNAPGHVGIGFTLMGHQVRGLNLNANWRNTYPSQEWFERLNVVEADIETSKIPFDDNTFDAVLFTEVLEHIGIVHPRNIIQEISRVLKPGGVMIFSTPNVCNISNLYALLKGRNIFWAPEIFYGSLDRHNREFTPGEVAKLMADCGLTCTASWGLNDYSNWRGPDGTEFATAYIEQYSDVHALCRNTVTGIYSKP